MTLLHCFLFKRPDEPRRGRRPHDPNSDFFSNPWKTYTFLLENVFFTKFQTCKRSPWMWTWVKFIAIPITRSWFSTQYHYAQHDENGASRLQGNDFNKIKMHWRRSRPPCSLLTIRITNPRECHGSKLCAVSHIVQVWSYFWKYFLMQWDPTFLSSKWEIWLF